MAWPEPMYDKEGKIKGYRGRYRDAAGDKQKVLDPDGQLFKRSKAAKDAATAKEVEARRSTVKDKATPAATITWSEMWDRVSVGRMFDSDNDVTEFHICRLYLRPYWGETPLVEIDQDAIQKWVDSLVDGTAEEWVRAEDVGKPGSRPRPKRPSPGYVQRIYSLFSVSMQLAADAKILKATPCVGIKLPRRIKKRKQYLPVEDAPQLGEHLKPHYQDAVDFGLETGTRPGELCGLHVDQIDESAGVVWLTSVLLTHKREIRSYPKDEDARQVPLTQKALEIIKRRTYGRNLTAGCGLPHRDGSTCTSALVFVLVPKGVAMNPGQLGTRMRAAADKAGLPRRSGYALRRGFATRLARAGLDLVELADVLGHEDIKLVHESYVQETPGVRGRLLAALGDPQPLQLIEGGAGARGATGGATPQVDPVADSGIEPGQNAG